MIVSSIFVIVLVKSGVTDSTGLDNNVTSWNMRDNSFIGINILIAVLLDTAWGFDGRRQLAQACKKKDETF